MIIDSYGSPTLREDLKAFDKGYGLRNLDLLDVSGSRECRPLPNRWNQRRFAAFDRARRRFHGRPWKEQLEEFGIDDVTHVVGLNHTGSYLAQIVDILRPEGQMALINDPKVLDIAAFKSKSLSVHWELMFTRSMFNTATRSRQHDLLNRVAALIDNGTIRSTMTHLVEGIRAGSLKAVHAQIESGLTRGKIVLEGF